MWTLYRPDGCIMRFYLEKCAQLYAGIWGGQLKFEPDAPQDTELVKPEKTLKLVA